MFVFANVARVGASAHERKREREGDDDDGTVDDNDDRYTARLFTKPVLLWFEARNRTRPLSPLHVCSII